MRHFIFALMIVLLPLRSWMGDAMAYSMPFNTMAQGMHTASVASNSSAGDTIYLAASNDDTTLASGSNSVNIAAQATPKHPCHGADTAPEGLDAQSPASNASNACTACQVCHLTACPPLAVHSLVQARTSVFAAQPPMLWTSADLSILTKPPVL